jgi:Cu(I)/Ag(I) efflux system membrane protein CusA/SilA
LLPIMWSTSVGAEVMKPLATPVLGGMISSLIHVLIVTPVIFFSIRERQLGLQHETLPVAVLRPLGGRRILITAVLLIAVMGALFLGWRLSRPPVTNAGAPEAGGRVVQTVRSGDMDIVVLSPTSTLRTGRNTFTIEFRSLSGVLVDMGTVRVAANMTMPGMAMSGNVQVQPADTPGRFTATAEFGMAGTWPISMEWNGPAGRGSANLEVSVQ